MIDRIFLNLIGIFSKLAAAILLSFAYFSIFSIINVDNNPFTIAGIIFISYLVTEAFMFISARVYETAILEELEELIEAAVLEEKEKKSFIKKNIRTKYTLQFELLILLIGFAFVVVFLATVFTGIYESGWGLKMLYSREILSASFIAGSTLSILFILMKMVVKFRLHRGLDFLKTVSTNAFLLYISLVFYVFSVIDSLFVLFG